MEKNHAYLNNERKSVKSDYRITTFDWSQIFSLWFYNVLKNSVNRLPRNSGHGPLFALDDKPQQQKKNISSFRHCLEFNQDDGWMYIKKKQEEVNNQYSETCYEQPLLWAANLLWEATLSFPKMTFNIQMDLVWAATCLERPLFLCRKGGCS